ncbi:hypothetical protein CYD53_10171 [Bosea psychrotolerans]|uniref:Uncharacterized protein n=1 Tax=Bosea psychrotolerans TaxID=1871628 RepID=A0A2S4MPC0_9HYPH|nr:hypothetical protein CYD53_10171 [Bosea psychrotolerans]
MGKNNLGQERSGLTSTKLMLLAAQPLETEQGKNPPLSA